MASDYALDNERCLGNEIFLDRKASFDFQIVLLQVQMSLVSSSGTNLSHSQNVRGRSCSTSQIEVAVRCPKSKLLLNSDPELGCFVKYPS